MSLVVVGINHRTAPLDVLESVAVLPETLGKATHDLRTRDDIAEVVVLSTCNRTEVYVDAARFHGALRDVRGFFSTWSGRPPEDFADYVYDLHEERAARHLLRVASGLDSVVIGESEVLRQVRAAWEASRRERGAGPVLSALFRQAVSTGKRVRAETSISRGSTSLAHAALALVEQDDAAGICESVLLIGAGEMGESMARALVKHRGGVRLVVTSRTAERASALAEQVGAESAAWEDVPSYLSEVDLVATSTAAPAAVLDEELVRSAMARRVGRVLTIVDLAVPRDVAPAVKRIPGVRLFDMDDLKARAVEALSARAAEVPQAEAIVGEDLERYLGSIEQRQVAPLVRALRDRAEDIRSAEIERARRALVGLDSREWRAVESLTRGLVTKLLHEPTVNLKAAAGTAHADALGRALEELFDL